MRHEDEARTTRTLTPCTIRPRMKSGPRICHTRGQAQTACESTSLHTSHTQGMFAGFNKQNAKI